jgi:DNA-binding XRE family transcriptional regulator
MTLDELAHKSNVSSFSIKKIENNKTVSTLTAGKLSNALQINIYDYFELI